MYGGMILSCGTSQKEKGTKIAHDNVAFSEEKRIYSPDRSKYIEIFKNGSLKDDPITQVVIQFENGASEVYSFKGIEQKIMARWVDNDSIQLKTDQKVDVLQKLDNTHMFGEKIQVGYLHADGL